MQRHSFYAWTICLSSQTESIQASYVVLARFSKELWKGFFPTGVFSLANKTWFAATRNVIGCLEDIRNVPLNAGRRYRTSLIDSNIRSWESLQSVLTCHPVKARQVVNSKLCRPELFSYIITLLVTNWSGMEVPMILLISLTSFFRATGTN